MVLKVSTRHTQKYAPEFLIFTALKLHSCELAIINDMNTYILTEDRSFKTFLKENYAIALNHGNLI